VQGSRTGEHQRKSETAAGPELIPRGNQLAQALLVCEPPEVEEVLAGTAAPVARIDDEVVLDGQVQHIRGRVAESGLRIRGEDAVEDEEHGARSRRGWGPQHRGDEQAAEDGDHDREARPTLVVVDRQPAVVDREAGEGWKLETHAIVTFRMGAIP
jgi:hypothetical protein